MPGQGRLGDKANTPSDSHGCPGCPHPATGPAVGGSPNVNVNGRPALRVRDAGIHAACCGGNSWEATKGSNSVFINGKPAHRLGDAVQHCGGAGRLIEGSSNVIVGGSTGSGGGPQSQGASPTPQFAAPSSDMAHLVVQVTDDKGIAIQGAAVKVDGLGTLETDKGGLADFGTVVPNKYHVEAHKDHHSPGLGQKHGPSGATKDVPPNTTTMVRLQLVPTCKSISLKQPFLIAQATDKALRAVTTLAIDDGTYSGPPLAFGQDITHSTGRQAPDKQSVGTTVPALEAKMRRLLGIFAAQDTSGMALRLFDAFLSKNRSVRVFADPSLDSAIAANANFVAFADRTVSAPGTLDVDTSKTRIHQALKAADWDINAVKPITDLGVPAFNVGSRYSNSGDWGNGLAVMINGVQYVFIYAQSYEYHSCTEEYELTLKFAMYDVFGLDDDDLRQYGASSDSFYRSDAAQGITAWWQLQHQSDYAPLLTRGIVTKSYKKPAK